MTTARSSFFRRPIPQMPSARSATAVLEPPLEDADTERIDVQPAQPAQLVLPEPAPEDFLNDPWFEDDGVEPAPLTTRRPIVDTRAF